MRENKKFELELLKGGYKDIHYNYDSRHPFPTPFKVTLDGVVLGQIKGGKPTGYQYPDYRWEPLHLLMTADTIMDRDLCGFSFFNGALTLRITPVNDKVTISLEKDDINPKFANYNPNDIRPVEADLEDVAFEFYKAYNDVALDVSQYDAASLLKFLKDNSVDFFSQDRVKALFRKHKVPMVCLS